MYHFFYQGHVILPIYKLFSMLSFPYLLLSIIVVMFSLNARESAAIEFDSERQVEATNPRPIRLVASIQPLATWLRTLAPKQADWEIVTLMPPGADFHHFAMKPSSFQILKQADLFVWLGPDVQPSFSRLVNSAGVMHWSVFDVPGVSRLTLREPAVHGHHNSKKLDWLDPHVWMSVGQLPALLDALSDELKPLATQAQKADIAKNLEEAKGYLDSLRVRLASFGQASKQPFFTDHDEIQYLEQDVGLVSGGAIVSGADHVVSARHLFKLRKDLEHTALACIFTNAASNKQAIENVFGVDTPLVELDVLGVRLQAANLYDFWGYIETQLRRCYSS